MKKLSLFVMILSTVFAFSQTQTENYLKTTLYKTAHQNGTYNNFTQALNFAELVVGPVGMGGGNGNIALNNSMLSVGFEASWSSSSRIRLGNIKTLTANPPLPNIELGQILTADLTNPLPTGYFAKIENNKLVFYSPYFLNGVNTTSTATISDTSINYSTSFNNYYVPLGPGGCSGQLSIANGIISIVFSGGWAETSNLKLGNIVYLNTSPIPDTDLGFIQSLGVNTIYKAKIESNYLVFYSTESNLPALPTSGKLSFSQNIGLTLFDKSENITYYDGVGRPKQSIGIGTGSGLENIYTHIEYDNFGRQTKKYLPLPVNNSLDESFYPNVSPAVSNDLLSFYNTAKYDNTTNYFTESKYEDSTSSKLLETASAGNNWSMASQHTIKFDYETNILNEVRKFYVEFVGNNRETPLLKHNGFYFPNELTKFITKDENWSASDGLNKTTQEFKDKGGKLILARRFNKDINGIDEIFNTYYVYDDFGNLSYVIPPLASDEIDVTEGTTAQASKTFPWTKLCVVNDDLAKSYEKLLAEYTDEQIANEDLYAKFGGAGQFTLTNIGDNQLELSIAISTVESMNLRTGEIVSLSDLGSFKETELGRIDTGNGYEYIFYIKGNSLWVSGKGSLKTINATFSGAVKLTYNMNFPWASLVELKSEEENEYLSAFKNVPNENILTTQISNSYGAVGGLNVMIDANDNVFVTLDINATNGLKFKNGFVIPLPMERKLDDVELFQIGADGYKYVFAIKENNIYIEGGGTFTSVYKVPPATGPPPTVILPQVPTAIISGLCYEYHYDNRNRLIEKRIPGTGWQYFVYDRLDRQVLSQDLNQRVNGKWLFTKYDVFNRVAYTGEFKYTTQTGNTDVALRIEIQNLLNATGILNENRTATSFLNHGIYINYTDNVFPKSSDYNVEGHMVNYYDNYDFTPNGVNTIQIPGSVYGANTIKAPKALATGTLIRILNNDEWIVSSTAYDDLKYRPVWVKSENSYLDTQDITETKFDFSGKVIETTSSHSKTGVLPIVLITDKYFYDHADRMLKHTQKINNTDEELIVFNSFDELGQLVQKKVGGQDVNNEYNNTSALQTIDMSYNVRGWLKKINDPDISLNDKLFAYKMNYDDPQLGGTALYNGNVSETSWKSRTDNVSRNYNYSYDDLSRLLQANYSSGNQLENYTEGSLRYDKNGNIIHLERYGLNDNGVTDMIDKLDYLYLPKSNKLKIVNDSGTPTVGFIDIHTANNDYAYDANGNYVSDVNKEITKIYYNQLNLPTKIVFNGREPDVSTKPKGIKFIYDASGAKVEKQVVNTIFNGSQWFPTSYETITYDGGLAYVNNELQFISQPEGYAKYDNVMHLFSYVYQYKDHLGNVRLSYTDANDDSIIDSNEIFDESNYYAFGMKHEGYTNYSPIGNELAQKYKFGGKEFQDDLSLNMYDFGARNYDAAIGRWMNVDPLAEKSRSWSIYNYAYDNPIYYVDPDGRSCYDWYQNLITGNIKWFRGVAPRAGYTNLGATTNVASGTGQNLLLKSNGTAVDLNTGKAYGMNRKIVVNTSTGWTVQTKRELKPVFELRIEGSAGLQVGANGTWNGADLEGTLGVMTTKFGSAKSNLFNPSNSSASFGDGSVHNFVTGLVGAQGGNVKLGGGVDYSYKSAQAMEGDGVFNNGTLQYGPLHSMSIAPNLLKDFERLNVEPSASFLSDDYFDGIDFGVGLKFLLGIDLGIRFGIQE